MEFSFYVSPPTTTLLIQGDIHTVKEGVHGLSYSFSFKSAIPANGLVYPHPIKTRNRHIIPKSFRVYGYIS